MPPLPGQSGRICLDVAEGSLRGEHDLLRAFIESINPPEADG